MIFIGGYTLLLPLCSGSWQPGAGAKSDQFDRILVDNKNKLQAVKDCPSSEPVSPFGGIYFTGNYVFARTSMDTSEACLPLVSIGEHSIVTLIEKAKSACGAKGDWKRRIVFELSAIFEAGRLEDYPREKVVFDEEGECEDAENCPDKEELVLSLGFQHEGSEEVLLKNSAITPEKYENLLACWHTGCDCQQAGYNPLLKGLGYLYMACALLAIAYDGFRLVWGPSHKEEKEE